MLGDALAQPHGEHRAGRVDDRHKDICEPGLIPERCGIDRAALIGKVDDDADCLHDGEHEREDAGIRRDLLFALFALFGKPLERGNADREQLHDDGRVDVRPDAEREQRALRQRAARDGAHQRQKAVGTFFDIAAEHAAVDAGNGNVAPEPVHEEQEQRYEDFFSDLFYFKCVL